MGAINSACNPVFYSMFMPSFRRALLNTVAPCVMKSVTEIDRDETRAPVDSITRTLETQNLQSKESSFKKFSLATYNVWQICQN